MNNYIFISYSTKNAETAGYIRDYLKERGCDIWIAPENIPTGSSYGKEIENAIKGAACFLLVLSDESMDSMWVSKELERALNYRKTVIPVKIDKSVLHDEFGFFLGNVQIIDVEDVKSMEMERVYAEVKKLVGTRGNDINAILEANRKNVEKLKLPVLLGMDSGLAVFADMEKMPHLIASGMLAEERRAFVTGLLTCLMKFNSPAQMQILIVGNYLSDYSVIRKSAYGYKGLSPETVEEEVAALNGVVAEMNGRYELFMKGKFKNLDEYNAAAMKNGNTPLPRVAVILERPERLLVAKTNDYRAQAENALSRLSRLARAAGIHLAVVEENVNYELTLPRSMLVNFPTRLTFRTSTSTASRMIIDADGAERLDGKGELLYIGTDTFGKCKKLVYPIADVEQCNKLAADNTKEYTGEDIITATLTQEEEYLARLCESSEKEKQLLMDAIISAAVHFGTDANWLKEEFGVSDETAKRLIENMLGLKIIAPVGGGQYATDDTKGSLDELEKIFKKLKS